VVPACVSPSDANCDIWEDHLIVPREFPGGYLDELHTVPEYAGDYYTRRAFTCADMVHDRAGGMTLQEFTQLKAAVVAHEIGHGLDIDHDTSCSSLMFDAMFFTLHRTMSDITPISAAFSSSHRSAIRLKE
jgi:hypothetical protein